MSSPLRNTRAGCVRGPGAGPEERLNPQKFIRVHRSAIINLGQVAEIVSLDDGRYDVTLNGGQKVTTSRSGGRALRDLTL